MARAAQTSRRWSEPPEDGTGLWPRVLWIFALVAWAFVFASLLSFDPADAPSTAVAPVNAHVANWCGPVGALTAYWLLKMFGVGIWLLTVGAAVALGLAGAGRAPSQVPLRALGLTMLALAVSGFHALFWPTLSWAPEGGGGLAAIAGVHELTTRFSTLGSALWLGLLALVGATVAFDWLVVTLPVAVWDFVAPRVTDAAWRTSDAAAAWRGRRGRASTARPISTVMRNSSKQPRKCRH